MAPVTSLLAVRAVQVVVLLLVSCEALPRRGRPASTQHHKHTVQVGPRGFLRQHPRPSRPLSLLQQRSHVHRSQSHLRAMRARQRQGATARSAAATTVSNSAAQRLLGALSFADRNKARVDSLMTWLAVRICGKNCGIDIKIFDKVTDNQCKSTCVASLNTQREASRRVHVLEEQMIRFPDEKKSLGLHESNDKTDYNAMMFAGGVMLNGETTFAARLCTHNCNVGEKYFDSTLIMGDLEQQKADKKPGNWTWKNAAEHWVPHHDGWLVQGDYSGPEDPRMDIVEGHRFLSVSMNVARKEIGCGDGKVGVHHMFFVPVDNKDKFKTCELQPSRIDKCNVQKNWATLVPRGSEDIFYVYSAKPLQMLRLKPTSCQTSWLEMPKEKALGRKGRDFDPTYSVHGGTRYVFGGQVADGDLFWSVGHTPTPYYMPVLIGLLMRNSTSAPADPHFEVVGVSCPIKVSNKYGDPSKRSDESWEDFILITTSIVDHDPQADISTLTFQVHDRDNYRSQITGVGAWLQTAYKESRKTGFAFRCDALH